MTATGHPGDSSGDGGLDPELVEWVADLADRVQAGEDVDLDGFAARHPGRAEELRRLLPAIAMMTDLGERPPAEAAGVPTGLETPPESEGADHLGDFQILREIARGGMGVVYEALQLSLNRRVALKVLPAASALDTRQLQRFRLETQAVACLNHPNVVPVFSVGRDRGVPYYAMPLIDGRSLAEIIRELRGDEAGEGEDPAATMSEPTRVQTAASFDLHTLPSGVAEVAPARHDRPEASGLDTPGPRRPAEPAGGRSPARQGTREVPVTPRPAVCDREFFRKVARMGCQAAEALGHAHQQGVLHRDVKPANLLVDAKGDLFVTDFGLARLHGSSDVTLSGDLVGTLRYMSPEQAIGRRGEVDHRTDVYSLGATLYELLTLRPAFEGPDREKVLRSIVSEEPAPLRWRNPSVPADLETVVLKAMAKNPADRYATAEALADDLHRFLEDRPIAARRPSTRDRWAKWARRHRPAVLTASAVAAFAVAVLAGAGWWSTAWLAEHNLRLRAARDQAERFEEDARRSQALAERRALVATRRLLGGQTRQAQEAFEAGHVERAQELLHDEHRATGPGAPLGFAWDYLWRAVTRDFDLLWGHDAGVHSVALSPDGATLATGDDRGYVILWDLPTRTQLLTQRMSPWRIHKLTFSADGKALAVITFRSDRIPGILSLWDLSESPPGPEPFPLPATEPPGGDTDNPPFDEPVNRPTGRQARLKRRWALSGTTVIAAVFAPGGDDLITAEADGVLRQRRGSDGDLRRTLPAANEPVHVLAVSPDGKTLAAGGGGPDVRLWDLKAERDRGTVRLFPATERVANLAFSPDGNVLAAIGLPSRMVRLRDLAKGLDLKTPPLREGRVHCLAFSPDGKILALAGEDETLRLWDLSDGHERPSRPGQTGTAWSLAFTPDGRGLVMGCVDPAVRLWHMENPPEPPAPAGHRAEAWAVAFTPDGRTLVTGGDDHRVKLWDRATGLERATLPRHGALVTSLAVSDDGRTLASASFDRYVRLWDLPSGRFRRKLVGHTDRVRGVAITPDGRTVASSGTDLAVRLWDTGTGQTRAVLRGHTDIVRAVAFSPDGSVLATAGNDKTVRFWDPARPGVCRVLRGREKFTSLAFSPDGSVVAAADVMGVLNVWDVRSGERRASLKGPAVEARAVAFSPDGWFVAAGYADRSVRLWDHVARQEVLVLKGHTAPVNALAFSPDGRTLASCDHVGAVKLWSAGPR